MNFALSTFDVVFPIGLGALFGFSRYIGFLKEGAANAAQRAAFDSLKAMAGAGVIVLAYKLLGIL